jgi:6-phosphogluconolactonase/glucosamine-6-phosphate isomerase/deaminase
MRLVITEDGAGAAQWVAVHVKRRITEFAPTADRPFVLGLPTGSSPISTYKVPWRTQHRTRTQTASPHAHAHAHARITACT